MKNTILHSAVVIMIIAMAGAVFSCSSSTGTGPPGGGGGTTTPEENYFGVTPSGDMVTLNIDLDNKEYTFVNITMVDTIKGTFTVSSDSNYSGAYITANNHYIIEVPGELFVTSVPLGNKQFGITFGITSHRNLNQAELTGNYIWLGYDLDGFDSWGGYAINSNGTYTWAVAPDSLTAPFDHFQGGGGGTWQVSPGDSSRISFTEGGMTAYGTILPGKLMIVDDPMHGYILGIKYPSSHTPFSQIAGKYTCIDYSNDDIGIGHYQLPSSSSPISWYIKYKIHGVDQGTSNSNLQQHPYVNNAFTITEGQWTTEMLILPGEIILHWCFEHDSTGYNLVSTGIGVKL